MSNTEKSRGAIRACTAKAVSSLASASPVHVRLRGSFGVEWALARSIGSALGSLRSEA